MINAMGIYCILNIDTDKYYIGSATNLNKRWSTHKKLLKLGKHSNEYLQNSWIKYGERRFNFIILEIVCDKLILIEREQFWLDATLAYDRRFGFNIRTIAKSNLGIRWSDQTKEKMSVGNKAKVKSADWLKNIKTSIINSPKNFKNKRNLIKWPHDKGKRCGCQECKTKLYQINKTRKYIKLAKLSMQEVDGFLT